MKYFLLLITLVYGGCSHTSTVSKVKIVDTQWIHLTTIHWGSDDLQEIAEKIVEDILSSDSIDFSKTYSFGKIRNDSHDHIDTKLLKNKIVTALVQNGKVKLSENKTHQSDGIFYGKISSIFKKNSRGKDMFFNFGLSLSDVQTTKVLWSADVEIRKVYEKGLIGW
jgi:hypothetical protein